MFESDKLEIPSDRSFVGWNYRTNFGLMKILRTNLLPRVTTVGWRKWYSIPNIRDIASGFGFSTVEHGEALEHHRKRLTGRLTQYIFIAIPVVIVFVVIPTLALLVSLLSFGSNFTPLSFLLVLLFVLFIMVPLEFLFIKVIFILLDNVYADSLCIQASLGVLVELTDPYVLNNPQKKRFLLLFLSEVARYSLLLLLCFRSSSERENETIRNHFHKIERFVQAQARLATIPKSGTLEELRKSFMILTQMFITGNYGDFEWREDDAPSAKPAPETPKTWYQSLLGWIGNIIGLGIPLTGLYYLITKPSFFEAWPLDTNSLTLIALVWLVLSIDSVLRLGITEKAIATIKEIKELI